MYEFISVLHSYIRWALLLLLVVVIVTSLMGWLGKKPFKKIDNTLSVSLLGTTHLQLLLGLILYFFLSPITKNAFSDFGAAMKNKDLRFYAVEHIAIMILAVVFVQLGRTLSKKAANDEAKFKKLFIYTTIALVLVLAGIPWNKL
jgi:Na+-driven multidrug efflux pump